MRLYTKITINIIEGRTGAYHAATVYVTWPEMMADMHHFEARLCNAGTMRHIVYEWLVRNNLMEYRSGLASIEFRKQGIACNIRQSRHEMPTGYEY